MIELFKQANLPGLLIPEYPNYGESVFNSFVVGHIESEKLARQLSSHGIDTSPGYLKPIQQISMFSDSVSYTSKLTNTNLLARVQLHLPLYPRLKEVDLKRIVESCRYSLDTVLHYEGKKEFSLPQVKEEKPHSVTYRSATELSKSNKVAKIRSTVDKTETYDIDSDSATPTMAAATHTAPPRPAAPPLPSATATHTAPPRPAAPPLSARPVASSLAKNILALRKNTTLSKEGSSDSMAAVNSEGIETPNPTETPNT